MHLFWFLFGFFNAASISKSETILCTWLCTTMIVFGWPMVLPNLRALRMFVNHFFGRLGIFTTAQVGPLTSIVKQFHTIIIHSWLLAGEKLPTNKYRHPEAQAAPACHIRPWNRIPTPAAACTHITGSRSLSGSESCESKWATKKWKCRGWHEVKEKREQYLGGSDRVYEKCAQAAHCTGITLCGEDGAQ